MSNEELVTRIQAGEPALLEQLYKQNRGLIVKACRKYGDAGEFEDLLQECFFAVSDAARLYNPECGLFATYLWFWLKQHIVRYVQDCGNIIRVPTYQRERIRGYKKALEKYRKEFGRDPSPSELARMLEITPEQLEQLKQDAAALTVGSLNEPVRGLDQEGLELQDALADGHNHYEDVLEGIQREELASVLWATVDTLEGRQADCIRMRYRSEMSLRKIAAQCGVSAEAVRQSIEAGLRVLRKPRNTKRLEPFLDDYVRGRGLKGIGIGSFRRTGTSSTEKAALKLLELENRIYGFNEL